MKNYKRDPAAVQSAILRRPYQRVFPLFLLPMFVSFCVGFIWPFIQALYLSFCSFITVDNAKWVGISNYVRALTDESFLHAFGFSVKFVIVATVLINVIAFLLALK